MRSFFGTCIFAAVVAAAVSSASAASASAHDAPASPYPDRANSNNGNGNRNSNNNSHNLRHLQDLLEEDGEGQCANRRAQECGAENPDRPMLCCTGYVCAGGGASVKCVPDEGAEEIVEEVVEDEDGGDETDASLAARKVLARKATAGKDDLQKSMNQLLKVMSFIVFPRS